MKGVITVGQAAEALNVTPARIRQMIEQGQLKADKIGKFWIVQPASLNRELHRRKTEREPEA